MQAIQIVNLIEINANIVANIIKAIIKKQNICLIIYQKISS